MSAVSQYTTPKYGQAPADEEQDEVHDVPLALHFCFYFGGQAFLDKASDNACLKGCAHTHSNERLGHREAM